MDPTIEQLEVLCAVADEGSFTAAARRLHRSISSVSYQVARLEEQLGLVLFDRSTRRPTLTPEGGRVLEEGRALVARAARLESVARRLREGYEPLVTLVVEGLLPLPPIMRALTAFGAEGLPTRARLVVEFLAGVRERFEDERAALMLALETPRDPALEVRPLEEVEIVLVARGSHPLARAERLERAALRAQVELIVADSARRPGARPEGLLFGSEQVFELSDFHAKREALLEGAGYGWLPRHLADAALAEGALVELPFAEGSRRRFAPCLVTRRDDPPGPGGRRLFELLMRESGT